MEVGPGYLGSSLRAGSLGWCGMAHVIATTDPYGNPQCPWCRAGVEQEGEFCSPSCWEDFHLSVMQIGEIIEMNYLTLEEQPWYGKHHG